MDLSGFGWRDLVLVVAMLAGVYLVVTLLGLARLGRREQSAVADVPPAVAPQTEPPTLLNIDIDIGPDADDLHTQVFPEATPVEFVPLDISTPEPPRAAFGNQLAMAELEAEVRQLRADVTALRHELAEMKEAPRVSPLYADAAALVHRGFDARGVAEECGISMAEAELVVALSRDDNDFDSEVDDGAVGRTRDAAR